MIAAEAVLPVSDHPPPLPERDEVLEALSRVTASPAFFRSERLCRFLRYVVTQTLDGCAAQLKEYSIGVEVFEKGADFDPRLDSAIRVDARRLRAKLVEYYATEGAADPVRISLPKGSYVPVFAWTGEQALAERVEPAPPASAMPAEKARSVWWGAAALALAAIGWSAWVLHDRYWSGPSTAAGVRSLAVLPFSNMTGSAGSEPLCDGLAEEMIDRLARLPGLRVVSRSSAFAFKGRRIDVREVARRLRVDSVLEGSVRENSDSLRITVQLVLGRDGSQLWSESFDLTKGDELGVQAHIARTVESRLAGLLRAGRRPAEPSEKERELDALLVQAGHMVQRRAEQSLLRAIEYAQRSLEVRPRHAPSHAVLADAWLALADHRQGSRQSDALGKASLHARLAADSNPSLAGPLTTLAAIAMDREWDWRRAEDLLRRAVRLNPNLGLAHARYARLLSLQGRHQEALEEARRAESLAPLSVTAIATVGHALFYARRYEEAIAQLGKALDIDPSYDNARLTIAKCYGFLNRYEEAWTVARAISPAIQQSAEAAALRAFLHARQNDSVEARRQLPLAAAASSISQATALSALGEASRALGVLEAAARGREINVVYVKISPGLDPLRGDPRIEALCRGVGLSGCAR